MLVLIAVPYGLGAGAIDASVNHYVANNYSGSVMMDKYTIQLSKSTECVTPRMNPSIHTMGFE